MGFGGSIEGFEEVLYWYRPSEEVFEGIWGGFLLVWAYLRSNFMVFDGFGGSV